MAENITLQLQLNLTPVTEGLKQLEGEVKKTTQKMQEGFGGNLVQKIRDVGLAYQGIKSVLQDVSRAVSSLTSATLDADKVDRGLEAALRRTGQASEGTITKVKALASSMQSLTTADDEAIKAGLTLYENITGLGADTFPTVTKAALGLSAAYGMDLNTAFQLLGRAAAGHTEMLGRMGITLDTTKSKEEQYQQALEIGIARYPQAEAAAKSYAGRIEQSKNAVNDFKETMGIVLLEAFQPFVSLITKAAVEGGKYATAIKLVTSAALGLVTAYVAWKGATIALTLAQLAFNLSIKANPIGAIVGVIVGLIAIIYTAVQSTIGWANVFTYVKEFGTAAIKIVWDYIKAFGTFLGNFGAGMLKVLTLPYQVMWQTAKEMFGRIAIIMKKLVAGDFKGVWQEIKAGVANGVNEALDSVQGSFGRAFNAFDNLGKKAADTWKKAGNAAIVAVGMRKGKAAAGAGVVSDTGEGGLSDTDDADKKEKEAQDEKVDYLKQYYDEVKFLDARYYQWKRQQIILDVQNMGLAAAKEDMLTDTRLAQLDAEKAAFEDIPKDALLDAYDEMVSRFSDEKQLGIISYENLTNSLKAYAEKIKQVFGGQSKEYKAALDAMQIAQMNWGKNQERIWRENHQFAIGTVDAITGGFKSGWDSMLDSSMTGRERMRKIWDSMAGSFMGMVGKMAADWVRKQLMMVAVSLTSENTKRAAAAQTAAVESSLSLKGIILKLKDAGAAILSAVAAGFKWLVSTLGPFGLAAGISLGAGIIAAFGALKKKLGFATGGLIKGLGGPTEDNIPVWASSGEYIINAAATRRFLPILESINSFGKGVPAPRLEGYYAAGGQISQSRAAGSDVSGLQSELRGLRKDLNNLTLQARVDYGNPKAVFRASKLGEMQTRVF